MGNVFLRTIFSESMRFVLRRKILFALSLILMAANLAFDLGLGVAQKYFFRDMTPGGYGHLMDLLDACVGLSILVIALMTYQYYCQAVAAANGGQAFMTSTLHQLYDEADYATIVQFHSADIVSRVTQDIVQTVGSVPLLVNGVGYQLLVVCGAFVLLWNIGKVPALLALLAGPLIFAIGRGLDGPIRRDSEDALRLDAAARATLQEVLQNLGFIRVYGLEGTYLQRFGDRRAQQNRTLVRQSVWRAVVAELSGVTQSAATFVCAYLIGGGVLVQRVSAGDVMTFLFLMGQVQLPFTNMSGTWSSLQQAVGSGRRVLDFQLKFGERKSNGDGEPKERRESGYAVTLDHIVWSPPSSGRTRPVIDGVSLDIPNGAFVAIVGPSGGGKTSLARIIAGLYVPTEGSVTIFGFDGKTYRAYIQEHIAYVPQTPYLFSGTIRENLRMVKPSAAECEMAQAVRLAGAHEFIQELPEGYDSLLAESGSNLSGGQRQRLALAQAILSDRPILILDEPTSALDSTTEETIRTSLDTMRATRTLIVITHHLSLANIADVVLEMNDGKIFRR